MRAKSSHLILNIMQWVVDMLLVSLLFREARSLRMLFSESMKTSWCWFSLQLRLSLSRGTAEEHFQFYSSSSSSTPFEKLKSQRVFASSYCRSSDLQVLHIFIYCIIVLSKRKTRAIQQMEGIEKRWIALLFSECSSGDIFKWRALLDELLFHDDFVCRIQARFFLMMSLLIDEMIKISSFSWNKSLDKKINSNSR